MKCVIEGCEKSDRLIRGWCNTHYTRWRRHGDPTFRKHGGSGHNTTSDFWAKVDKSGGPEACWLWTGCLSGFGYGSFAMDHVKYNAHRLAWILVNGPIPKGDGFHGTCVCHRCDNPKCCNPRHLFLGSQNDNLKDMTRKGRHRGTQGFPINERAVVKDWLR